jgi:hypothetical protein
MPIAVFLKENTPEIPAKLPVFRVSGGGFLSFFDPFGPKIASKSDFSVENGKKTTENGAKTPENGKKPTEIAPKSRENPPKIAEIAENARENASFFDERMPFPPVFNAISRFFERFSGQKMGKWAEKMGFSAEKTGFSPENAPKLGIWLDNVAPWSAFLPKIIADLRREFEFCDFFFKFYVEKTFFLLFFF